MGIDPSTLPPWAQKQITEKLLKQQRERAQSSVEVSHQAPKPNKYRNQPAERIAKDIKTIKFQSQKEARRYDELMLLLQAGKIRDLKLQPQFTLQESYVTPSGERVRAIIYKADFSYEEMKDGPMLGPVRVPCWEKVIEDVKSKGTRTDKYKIKRKMMLEKGFTITEV